MLTRVAQSPRHAELPTVKGRKVAGLEELWEGKQQQHSKAGMQPGNLELKGLLHSSWRHYLLNRH